MKVSKRTDPRRLVILFAFSLATLVIANPALALTSTNNMAVACDGVTIKSGVTVFHDPSGTFKIKQNSATPTSSTYVFARSDNGNDLSHKLVSNGTEAVWTSVIANNYTVKAYRNGGYQCNGILPGWGNYTLNYTVTYN